MDYNQNRNNYHNKIPDKIDIVFLSRIVPKKNLLYAIETINAAYIGDGKEKHIVNNAAATDDRITAVSKVNLDHLYNYHAMADAYIHPGKEPYSCTVMQAAASAMSVVLTMEVGAIDDFLHDGENGIIVPLGNVERIHDALIKVYCKKEKFTKSAKDVQNYVCNNLAIEHAVDQLFKAIIHATGVKKHGKPKNSTRECK